MSGFTIISTPHTRFPVLSYVLESLEHISLVLYDDNNTQLADTSQVPFKYYSPKLFEADLNRFLVRNMSKYWSYINDSNNAEFHTFWEV